jgi:hypothetical protein
MKSDVSEEFSQLRSVLIPSEIRVGFVVDEAPMRAVN